MRHASGATATATAPTTNLCSTGTATAVAGNNNGKWNWDCNGSGGGTSTSGLACSAPYPAQTITLSANPTSVAVGGTASTVTADNDSGLTPTLSSTTTGFCTLGAQSGTGMTATASATGTHPGTCTIKANRASTGDTGTSRFLAAAEKTADITVGKGNQTLTFGAAPSNVTVGGTGTVSATSSAGLTVTFTSTTTVACTMNGSTVTGVASGTNNCTIAADQAGDGDYNAATQVTQTFSIAAAPTGPVNGACGTAHGTTTTTAPAANLCSAGSASTVTDTGTGFSWSCAGTGGGTNASCSAIKPVAATTAGAPTGLFATAGDSKVTVSFLVPSSNGGAAITNYRFSIDDGASFQAFNPAVTQSPVVITGLTNGTTYSIKLQAVNSVGNGTASNAVAATPQTEIDADGVADSSESQVPSASGGGTGDGNNDGVPDSQQSNVASLPTATGTFVTAAVAGAGITLSNVVVAATPADFPSTSSAPLAGLAFTVNGVGIGASQVIDLFFPASVGITGLSKRNLATNAFEVLPTTATTVGNKTRIRFTLTDGGDFDADRAANGTIQDPVFPFIGGGGSGGGGGALSLVNFWLLLIVGFLRRRFN